MNNLIFTKLYIIDSSSHLAKVVEFTDGINIVQSNKEDGNNRGKSLILKSLYHALGADSYFDSNWPKNQIVYILQFKINDDDFTIYRQDKLFYLFDGDLNLLEKISNRRRLSEVLYSIHKFKVLLPDRDRDELVIASPAYTYLFYYIDEDHMSGTGFKSFDGLYEFKKWKENLIYTHFGIHTQEFYKLTHTKEKLNLKLNTISKSIELYDSMISKISDYLGNNNIPTDTHELETVMRKYENEYIALLDSLEKAKKKLVKARNTQYELNQVISDTRKHLVFYENSPTYKPIVNCPSCSQKISDGKHRLGKILQYDDLTTIQNKLQYELGLIEDEIVKYENRYNVHLTSLNEIRNKITERKSTTNDILTTVGYLETKKILVSELDEKMKENIDVQKDLDKVSKSLKSFTSKTKLANEMYSNKMAEKLSTFGITRYDTNSISGLSRLFKMGGSTSPIIAIIWLTTLLEIKTELNPDAIRFPIVMDSPRSAALDLASSKTLLKSIFSIKYSSEQIILSALEIEDDILSEYNIKNIIHLDNVKNHLLNKDDYESSSEFVKELSRIGFESIESELN